MVNVEHSEDTLAQDKFDYVAGRVYLQKKQAHLQARRLELWQRAQTDAQNIINMIRCQYKPQRIIQWGSVLEARHFSEASDIDLAIEGVDALVFLQLLGHAEELTDFALDLLRWEEVPPAFQKVLLMKGKVVYAKD